MLLCSQVLNFVRVSLESHRVNLLSLDHGEHGPGEESLPLLVDNTLKEFTISVSGEKPKIQAGLVVVFVKTLGIVISWAVIIEDL